MIITQNHRCSVYIRLEFLIAQNLRCLSWNPLFFKKLDITKGILLLCGLCWVPRNHCVLTKTQQNNAVHREMLINVKKNPVIPYSYYLVQSNFCLGLQKLVLGMLTICSFHAKGACQLPSPPVHSVRALPVSLPRHVGPASHSWIPKPTGEAAGTSPWQTQK